MEKIKLEIPTCPICKSSSFRTVIENTKDHIWRKPGLFTIQRCIHCSLVMTRPRPDATSLGFYYENTYSNQDQDGIRRFQTESMLMRLISKYRLRVMEKHRSVEPEDIVLDVGCSHGGFLNTLHHERRCKGVGLDLDVDAIAQVEAPEALSFHVGELGGVELPTEHFDWITFWESLEHHREPIQTLTHAYRLLKPGGILCIEVPNYNGFWRFIFGRFWLPLLMPQHLFHFTAKTLDQTARSAGFEHRLHHQCMFYPLEGVASLGIALAHWLKSPPPGSPVSWRTPFDITLFLLLAVIYFLVEIPSQLILRFLGCSGHQLALYQKPSKVEPLTQDEECSL